jgi:hypothetical protein
MIGQCDHSSKCRKIWCIYNTIEQTWKTPPLPTHIRTYIRTYLSSLCTLQYGTIRRHGTRKKPKPGSQPRPAAVSSPSFLSSVRRSPFSPQKHLSLTPSRSIIHRLVMPMRKRNQKSEFGFSQRDRLPSQAQVGVGASRLLRMGTAMMLTREDTCRLLAACTLVLLSLSSDQRGA